MGSRIDSIPAREGFRMGAGPSNRTLRGFYEPHAGCFFDGADPLQLMRQVPNLLAFHIEERSPGRSSQNWTHLPAIFACNA
jgi:hypothetical protein